MSIIRYRYKADKNFESVKIDGMSCSLGELKRLIAAKSSRPGVHQPKHDYDLIISNANTHEEYKDNSDLIPRNASVIVARRIRGTSEALTPFSNQKPVVSSDDIVNDILLPAILNQKHEASVNMAMEKVNESPSHSGGTKEMTENELIKEIQMGSQARYVTTQPSYRTNLFVCHNCKQPGHIKSQCPMLLSSNSSSTTTANASSTGDQGAKSDGSPGSGVGPMRSAGVHPSNIFTRHAPYQNPYYHSRGGRSHHRGSGHPRGEPIPKKTTGIPRDRLIPVPKHIPGALKDPTGASVVPRQMAELFVERIGKKSSPSGQLGKTADGKGLNFSSKAIDDDPPPDDLLCPLCKQVCRDAVITPCCNFSFCDDCIRTALIESPDHQCPHCDRQNVPIDQINPNRFLRNHVNRWRERFNQLSYSHLPPLASNKLETDGDLTPKFNAESIDEFDAAILSSTNTNETLPVKSAPIVINMQPMAKGQSPPRPTELAFEDEKSTDSDPAVSNLAGEDSNPQATPTDRFVGLDEKSESDTPPMTSIYSSTSSPVPHYYPPAAPPQMQTNVLYPHHLAQGPPTGLYPIPQNYYSPPMGIRYPPGPMHGYPPYPPVHHHAPPAPPPAAVHHPLHVPNNGYNVPAFLPHAAAPFASTSTSTFITHHQTATQPISTALTTALSEDEFYIKQRYFKRLQRSPSRRRTRSRSSSYSSYSSSDSRSSSRSRHRGRRSRSRSRRRVDRRRTKSPIRQRRSSSSYRTQRPRTFNREKYSYRRSSPRRSRERRRSPRPPPTVQQSTQRTIVYMHESSSQNQRDRHRRTRTRSTEDRRVAPAAKTEQKSQPDVVNVPPALSSTIESVVVATEPVEKEAVSSSTNPITDEPSAKNGKKHKKHHHHHKKHRRQGSKSKKRHRSKEKEKEKKVVGGDEQTDSTLQVQA